MCDLIVSIATKWSFVEFKISGIKIWSKGYDCSICDAESDHDYIQKM